MMKKASHFNSIFNISSRKSVSVFKKKNSKFMDNLIKIFEELTLYYFYLTNHYFSL